jgi:hypothetical protein
MRRAERVVGRENSGLKYKRRRGSGEDENRDKKVLMMQLIL